MSSFPSFPGRKVQQKIKNDLVRTYGEMLGFFYFPPFQTTVYFTVEVLCGTYLDHKGLFLAQHPIPLTNFFCVIVFTRGILGCSSKRLFLAYNHRFWIYGATR